jgi:hypothetical protein
MPTYRAQHYVHPINHTNTTQFESKCRLLTQSFIVLSILPLQSQYIFSLLCYMINNMHSYQFVSDVHNRVTRQGCNFNLYQPSAHPALYLKWAYYVGIRVLNNNLPVSIKKLNNNPVAFKWVLNTFLCEHSFYTLMSLVNDCLWSFWLCLIWSFLLMSFLFIFFYDYFHILNVRIYGM